MERNLCRTCGGAGRETGHRSRWIGSLSRGYRSEWTVEVACERCGGSGHDPFPEPNAAEVIAMIEVEGKLIDAPGFTAEKFVQFVDRAKAHQLRTHPGNNAVMVMSTRSDARYATRRDSCTCQGHQSHGRCLHRALTIYLHDVQGVDVMKVPTIGFSKRGVSLTVGRKPAAKASCLDRPVVSRFRGEVA